MFNGERWFGEPTFTRQIGKRLFDLLIFSPIAIVIVLWLIGYYDEHPAYRPWGILAATITLLIGSIRNGDSFSLRVLLKTGASVAFLWVLLYDVVDSRIGFALLALSGLLDFWPQDKSESAENSSTSPK